MLINDLKDSIKKYDVKELEKIIIELYKRLPKGKKEDYNIDEFIKNIKTEEKTTKKEISFSELKEEFNYFLTCVDNEYYIIPNKVVSKKERSLWRFKVKNFYKELNKVLPNSDNGSIATFLLIELFKRLSIGSNRLLFITFETFNGLGISQSEYYDVIMKRILYHGYTQENLKRCIDLFDVCKDPYELSYDMFESFVFNLKTMANKDMAITLLKSKVELLKSELKNERNDKSQFYIEEDINNCVKCITNIYIVMYNYDLGIKYFQANYLETDHEIKEYILLNILDDHNLKSQWLEEYEKNIKRIDFRDSLKQKYKELKKQN